VASWAGVSPCCFPIEPTLPPFNRARRFHIEARHLPAGCYRTRLEDEQMWIDVLRSHGVELVLLAGFMRRLHAPFLDAYADRILNIHPSLLPAFPGRDAIRQAWQHGVRVTGCTVHLVTVEVDAGPILAQECVPVADCASLFDLEARVHQAEHRLYPATVRRFLSDSWRREEGRILFGESRC
jgi:phosphoribosylglycinamide formyltransferase-1